ncbi:hypothetical protein DFH11DRAFT_1730105 [Phellopilus nigrolimitatus]|nr:hypothetical protein DFH11DRAFT_1730105 [Phellopilus nigrolimitatus]
MSSLASGGAFRSAHAVGDTVTLICLQASGALYGACLNCDIVGTSRLDIVDAHNEPSGGAYGIVTTLTSTIAGASLNVLPSAVAQSAISTPPKPLPTALPPEPPILSPVPTSTSPSVTATSFSSSAQISSTQRSLTADQRLEGKMRSPLRFAAAVGLSLLVLCIALFALLYFMRRRCRRRKAPYIQISEQAEHFGGKEDLEVWEVKSGGVEGDAKRDRGGSAEVLVRVTKGATNAQLIHNKPIPQTDFASISPPSTPPAIQQAARRSGASSHPLFPANLPSRPVTRPTSLPGARPGVHTLSLRLAGSDPSPNVQRLPSRRGLRDLAAAAHHAVWARMASFTPPDADSVAAAIPPALVKTVRFADLEAQQSELGLERSGVPAIGSRWEARPNAVMRSGGVKILTFQRLG